MAMDLQQNGQLIKGTGAATATATLAALSGNRGYVLAAAVEVTAGTATLCRLTIQDAGVVVYAETFPVQAAATAAGGAFQFPMFIPFTIQNSALTIVATTTGATTTNVYAVVCYGP